MQTKHVSAEVHAASDSGEFDLLLSSGALDRDGEVLDPSMWMRPLPESVAINVNHSGDVADVVGSGRPWIDGEGNLRVTGKFAQTEQAQKIRALVTGGHIRNVSVEFLRRPDGRHELVGGAFVNVPANPEARVLMSKSALADFEEELNRLFDGGQVDDCAKAAALLRLRLKVAGYL